MVPVARRVALVTGGASGIGRAAALALARQGIAIVVADVSLERMEITRNELGAVGQDPLCVIADVRDSASVRQLVATALDHFGRIDILVNSAGIFPLSSVGEMPEREWDEVLDTNLKGPFLCSQAVIGPMRAQGGGRIISIGTGRGTDGYLKGAHYSASKAGLIGLSKSLALETRKDGITVNIISPGLTDTPQVRQQHTPAEIEQFLKQRGARLGRPEDVTGLLLYLVSEDAGHITGQVFTLRFP